ncbi:MAG: hypothetical protein H0W18_13135, partial [Acidobacteria bacterium]|nr:hypothetical protein [Acidobacteriota bacterium]
TETAASGTNATAPVTLPTDAEYIAVSVRTDQPGHPEWQPVHVYFRRDAGGWKTVGVFR